MKKIKRKEQKMLHIIVGIIAIVIGLWGIMGNWYMFKDVLVAIVPPVVLCFGIVAILAGIRSMKAKWAVKEASEED
jgi:uncharacterized membrane protein